MSMELKMFNAAFGSPADSTTGNELLGEDEWDDIVTSDGVKLVDKTMCSLQVVKEFQENTEAVNSIDFSKSGDVMVSASDDDVIIMYDCESGSISRNLKSKKYGVSHIRCTHTTNSVLHASTKIDDTLRYVSLNDNKYIRYFQGHTNRVTGISVSPIDERFLSTSLDKTLRIWDLRSPNCQGLMRLQEPGVASMDPEGLIFAVVMKNDGNDSVKLYDLRSFDKGPFSTFRLPFDSTSDQFASLKFSPNGLQILITKTGTSEIRILDAFNGNVLHRLAGHQLTKRGLSVEASYTPDSQYVVSGSEDGKVYVWNADTGHPLCILNACHPRPIQCVRFNPKYMLMSTACTDLNLWVPRIARD